MSNKADFSGVSSSVDTTAQVVSQSSPAPAAQTHTVAKGDTLSAIARHYLGKATDWPKIFEANRDLLTALMKLKNNGAQTILDGKFTMVMAVDAAIHDEGRSDDGMVFPGLAELFPAAGRLQLYGYYRETYAAKPHWQGL